MRLQLLRSPGEVEDFFRLLRQQLQFGEHSGQRLHHRVVVVAVLLQKLFTIGKSGAAFALGQQAKEKPGALTQAGQGLNHSRRDGFLLLQRGFNITRQLLKTQVTHADAKITSGHIFQFMRFVKNRGGEIRQHSGIRAARLPQRCWVYQPSSSTS